MSRFFVISRATRKALKTPPPVVQTSSDNEQLNLFSDVQPTLATSPGPTQPPAASPKVRKRRCTEKLTKEDFDKVMEWYNDLLEYNKTATFGGRLTNQHLTDRLNREFGYNKTVTVYANIWRGETKRHELPSRAELQFL